MYNNSTSPPHKELLGHIDTNANGPERMGYISQALSRLLPPLCYCAVIKGGRGSGYVRLGPCMYSGTFPQRHPGERTPLE